MTTTTVLTIGHSTRPIDEFTTMLRDVGVTLLADVRTVPKSRFNPQFETGALAASLAVVGIGYRHMKALGGLRKTLKTSINTAWRNASFRGYADYMQTSEFEEGLSELIQISKEKRVAIMCAEGNPFRCHRSLLADALLAHGVAALEIGAHGKLRDHQMTSFAHVTGTLVTYPGVEA